MEWYWWVLIYFLVATPLAIVIGKMLKRVSKDYQEKDNE